MSPDTDHLVNAEIITVYSENHGKTINTLYGHNEVTDC
jgi:hypothetical protein